MARLSTYSKDATITSQDKLIGSNYGGVDNQGRPIFTTANYKIQDLLAYFQDHIDIGGGNLNSLFSDLNKLKENYTYDENGNLIGLSSAYVGIIANSAVSDYYATAQFQTNLETYVLTFDENGLATVAEAFANQVFNTTSTSRFAESQYVNNLGASFGTVGADGTITQFSSTYLDKVVLYTDANSATASKVTNLNATLGILDENGDLLYENAAAYKQDIYNFVDTTGGISSAFESVDLVLNGDGVTPGLTGSVSTLQQVQGDIVSGITSAYGLEVDANGRIASMKLLANNISGTQIVFNADAFLVYTGTEDAAGNPINSAPFKIEGGTVYAKKIAFGDIDGVPDYFLTTVLYADDDAGTNPSLVKLAGQNYYGIFQSNEPYDPLTSDLSAVEWLQITGDPGISGENARAIKLVASSYVIPYEPDGTTESETITFATEVQGTTGALQYRFDIIDDQGNVTLGTASATNTFTLPDENEPTFSSFTTVKVVLLENSVEVATDSVSIYGVRSGSDAITAFLTNQAHVAPADTNGDNPVLTGSGGNFKIFIGANDVSSQCTFSVNSFDTGLTIAIDANGAYTITGLTVDLATAVLRAVVPASITKYPADSTFDITYTIAKAKKGETGQNGTIGVDGARVYTTNLFYQSIVTDETVPTFDATNLVYDFSTASFTGIPSGWGTNPPSTSPGSGTNALYYVAVNVVEGDPQTINVGNPTTYFNFNGLVTFTTDPNDGEGIITDSSGNTFKHTSIDGALIKTGQIQAQNFTFVDANGDGNFDPDTDDVATGTIIDLVTGYIKTPKLYLAADGNAIFSGNVKLGGTTLTENNTLNENTTKTDVGLANVDNVSTTTIYQTAATAANVADKTAGTVGGWEVDDNYIWSGTKQTTNAFSTDGITLAHTATGGAIRAKNFRIDTDGSAYFQGTLTGSAGNFGGVTIDGSGITSTYFTVNASGASLIGSLQVNDADGDTAVLVHDGTFIGAELSGVTSTAANNANLGITTWDATKNITSSGETLSSLRDYLNDNVIYSAVESIVVPAGSFTHSLSTAAITDPIVSLSADWYGFMRVTHGVQFGNSDFSTIYYEREFPNINIEAGQSTGIAAVNGFGISLVFNSQTTVYVRFYLKRTWKTQFGTASFTPRAFSVTSNLQFAGVKGKTEISPNGIQVFNTDDIYFKVDRENFTSGNPYVDIGGDTRIDGDLEVTGSINLVGEVNNSDVTVDNLRDRLGELDLTTNIGDSTGITVNVRNNLSVVSNLNVGGNTTISGDLTVSGTTTTINATNLAITDNMIYLNNGSTISNPDIGIAGNYNDGTYAHTGFFRDADDGRWKVYDGYTLEPDASAFIDTAHTSFNLADIQANHFYGNLTGNVSGNITTSSFTLGGTAVNATAAELNGLHQLTANRAIVTDANGILTETIVTATSLSYLNGASSNIQDQINGKQDTITGAASTITGSNLTASKVLISDSNGKVSTSTLITTTELDALNGITGNIQNQISGIGNQFFPTATFSLDNTFKALYKATAQDDATEVSFHIKGGGGVSNTVKISSSSDGNIFVSVLNSNAVANFYYIIAQDSANPENYVLYARTGSGTAANFSMQFLDSDIADVGFVEVLTKPGATIPAWTTKLHEIRIGGSQQFVNGTLLTAFDNTIGTTAILGTDPITSDVGHLTYIAHDLVVKGSITADDVQSTSEANNSKKTATVLSHTVATTGRYDLAELGTALTTKRAYLKFIIYGNGHYTEKAYVVHCAATGQWTIKVATEESTGDYDVIFNGLDSTFELYRHNTALTDDVSIIFEYMQSGNALTSNILTLT